MFVGDQVVQGEVPKRRSHASIAPLPIIKKPENSIWRDPETRQVDRGLLFAFPALFALFNAIYWSLVINGGGMNQE